MQDGGHNTSLEFRENIEAPFFRYYLHGEGEKPAWQAITFQPGSNTWRTYATWPPAEAKPTNLYLHADGTLSFTAPAAPSHGAPGYRQYVSDPANPVPYRERPISPTYPGGDWRLWEVADQRFVDNRPDVLTYVSAPLDHDLTVTGQLAAKLFASTSGTDGDFVVKLIDVYPQNAQKNAWKDDDGPAPGEYAKSLNGYELPVAMEVRRGRYLKSFEKPEALKANAPTEWDIPLRDHDYVFLKGHSIMVQIQSTWFPVIDRNPQKFVPSIYQAAAADFVPATQRMYSHSGHALTPGPARHALIASNARHHGWPTIAFGWQLWGSRSYTFTVPADSIASTTPAPRISLPSPVITVTRISPTPQFATSLCATWNAPASGISSMCMLSW